MMNRRIKRRCRLSLLLILIGLGIFCMTVFIFQKRSNKLETTIIKMQQTLEVLLKTKIDEGEDKRQKTTTVENLIDLKETVIMKSTNECNVFHHQMFPLCVEKYKYLKVFWKVKCFAEVHGVDGSDCSVLEYLSQIEPYCADMSPTKPKYNTVYAKPNFELDGLLKLLPSPLFDWMRGRVKQMWSDWVTATKQFVKHKRKWKKKKVLALMGSMGFQPRLLKLAGKGGPLGELVQWSDLISSLYLLGYDVRVELNATATKSFMDSDDENHCARSAHKNTVDVIYTDSNGVVMQRHHLGSSSSAKYRCMYRVLDSFGTFVEYNYPLYPHEIPGGRSVWANQNLIPTQMMTLYPHTHDNHFLGFVVGSGNIDDKKVTKKQNKALIYAKHAYYIKDYISYLGIVNEYFHLEATAVNDFRLPNYITNHGPVTGTKVQELLLESKVFIGVGFPYEGPGPIEALAAGTVFLQPKFAEPKSTLNSHFFKGKPTLRKLYSQSPYMEEFVGEPYCYTIDIKNETLLRSTLKKIKNMKQLPPKIPKEFTNEGMLERVHVFTEHMDYCNPRAPRWPPLHHLQIFLSNIGQSCKDVCMSRRMVCERTYFDDINTQQHIEKHGNIVCSSVKRVNFLHPPSYDGLSKACYVQVQPQLFSCMHESSNYRRLCPCRRYEEGQSALCESCL